MTEMNKFFSQLLVWYQSAYLVWSPLGSLDESQGPLSELPIEVTRRGKDVNSRYDFVSYTDKPVDLSPLFENLDGITYITEELAEVKDNLIESANVEAAQIIGQVLLDKRLNELSDKARYEELVTPIQHIEQRFGGGRKTKKPPVATKATVAPVTTAAGVQSSKDAFDLMKKRFAATNADADS